MSGHLGRLLARLERLESLEELRRLAVAYCVAADTADADAWDALWTDDAVWQVSPDQAFTGRDEIAAAARRQWAALPRMQHASANHVLDLDDDHPDDATGRADVVVMVTRGDGLWVVGGGTYADAYRRVDGGWRIARRTVERPFDLGPLQQLGVVQPGSTGPASPPGPPGSPA